MNEPNNEEIQNNDKRIRDEPNGIDENNESVAKRSRNSEEQSHSEEANDSVNSVGKELNQKASGKRDQNWETQFEALLAYATKYNHCNVRPGYTVDLDDNVGVNLYAWLTLQRRHKKQNKLRPDRLRKLQILVDANKLSWSPTESEGKADDDDEYVHVLPPPPPPSWQSHYDALLVYMEATGTANVPVGHVVAIDGGTKIDLGSWLEDQRKAKAHNTLEGLHLRRLDNLAREDKLLWHINSPSEPVAPVSESTLDAQWREKYEATKAYVALHPQGCIGDDIDVRLRIEVPAGQQPSNPFDLFQWIRAQRMCHHEKTLRPYRQQLLQQLVDQNLFTWMSPEEIQRRKERQIEKSQEEDILWTAWYNALVWLGNNRGECNLNCHGTITLPDGSEAELGKWLHIQKKYIKKGTLSVDRCLQLLQLIQENKLDRGYWVKYFHMSYPPGTFVTEYPELFPGQTRLIKTNASVSDSNAEKSDSVISPSKTPEQSTFNNGESLENQVTSSTVI